MDFIQQTATLIQLIFMDGILSIDNAAIFAAMASTLPISPIWLPYWLEIPMLRKIVDRLGMQPAAAITLGIIGASVLRVVMLPLALLINQNEFIKLFGALYLVKLAMKNLSVADQPGEHAIIQGQKTTNFWLTIISMAAMGMVFSIDNVLIAIAITDEYWLLTVAIVSSVLILVIGTKAFNYFIRFEPRLISAAYFLILEVGVGMVIEMHYGIHVTNYQKLGLSLGTIALTLLYSKISFLRWFVYPAVQWFGQGFGNLNEIVDWALRPLIGTLNLVRHLIINLWKLFQTKPNVATQ